MATRSVGASAALPVTLVPWGSATAICQRRRGSTCARSLPSGTACERASSVDLRGCHRIARHGRSAHVARLRFIEAAYTMHGLAVVPHHQVVLTPDMRVDERPLRGMFGQIADEIARLGHRPAHDR